MRKRRTNRDEAVEAVLQGEQPAGEDELGSVAEFVGDLRATYQAGPAPVRSPELTAFMEAPALDAQDVMEPTWRTRLGRSKAKMLSGLSGFLATVTGKVVLGGAVAAASVGGLHAGDVVDVPGLPDNDRPAAEESANGENGDLPDEAVEGQETADEKRTAAEEYTDAVQAWTDCVSENAAAQGDDTTRTTGEFDPRGDCGDRPSPEDFGLTEAPDQADDEGVENSEEGRENAPDDPGTPGDDGEPGDDPTSNDPTGNSERSDSTPAPASDGDDDDAEDNAGDNAGNGADAASENGSTGTDTADDFQP